MMAEHDTEGERYYHIEKLTNGYKVPEDACNSYRFVLKQLKDFEAALPTYSSGKQYRISTCHPSGKRIKRTVMTQINIRRVYETPETTDGYRVLVDHL